MFLSLICWFLNAMFIFRSDYCPVNMDRNYYLEYCAANDKRDFRYVFYHNFVEWTLFYYNGLNYTYLDYLPSMD